MTQVSLDRRCFLVGASLTSAGFALAISHGAQAAPMQTPVSDEPEINAWVVIEPDETVTIRIARSEMGQGSLTGLAQLVAEELECDWSKVRTEYPSPRQSFLRKRPWGDFATGGSRGVRGSQEYMRMGGATAREMLLQAAAEAWGAPKTECTVARGVITHSPTGRVTTYGKVAPFAARLPVPATIALKDPSQWTLAGKPLRRLDTVEKTTGAMRYGIDVAIPGLMNAAIRHCPTFGGKVKSFNSEKAMAMRGVKSVVRVDDYAVAVVADTWWRANKALEAVAIEWDEGPNAAADSSTIADWLREGLEADQPAFVGSAKGDAKAALAQAKNSGARIIEADYAYPWQVHAALEPLNATALYTEAFCRVWTGTQNGEAAFAAVVEASGLAPEKCDVTKMMIGGGFGRRGATDYVREAVLIAKQTPGVPVKLLWSREEDMQHGQYHPTTQCRLRAALDEKGEVSAFHMRLSGQSILSALRPQALQNGKDPAVFQGLGESGDARIGYSFPHVLIDHSMRNPPVPPGFWRGVNINQNAIYLECFIDELAAAVKQDSLEFRRRLMKNHPKHLAVLEAVAAKAQWDKPAPNGIFRGLAQHMGYGSYVAAVVEISVYDGNKIKIHRIVAATDPGTIVNPAQVERQISGSFVYGLSALFYGECTLKNGAIEQSNFDAYNSLRMGEFPEVETILTPSGGFWGGVGEPTICVAAPALLNAYAAATGRRVRSVPLKNQNILIG